MVISLQSGQFYQNMKETFLQKMNVNLKDICVSLKNKELTGQEKLEEITNLTQFNTFNYIIFIN